MTNVFVSGLVINKAYDFGVGLPSID